MPGGGQVWLGAERHRSQELGSPSHVSKVDLHAVGMWGEGGGPCGGRSAETERGGERETGGSGEGMSEPRGRGLRMFLWTSGLGRGKLTLGPSRDSCCGDLGSRPVPSWKQRHREDALLMAGVTVSPPGGRWVADVGSWGPEQQSPATPRCTPCWVPEAAGGANPLAGCLLLLACHQWKHQ